MHVKKNNDIVNELLVNRNIFSSLYEIDDKKTLTSL